MEVAYIIGNGPSRKKFELNKLKGRGAIYGCNALYRDHADLVDYLVAIDEPIINEINESDFPKEKFIVPPFDEQFEDPEYNQYQRFRSNAGVNAMLEAIKTGYTALYCLGFDFMIKSPKVSLGNLYDGTNAYGPETRSRYQDNLNRVKYMQFLARKYNKVKFTFVVPQYGNQDEYHNLNASNVFGIFYDSFEQTLLSSVQEAAVG
jgi:hypothetical protein|tara:strand:- start:212 stop:826 length:615 start_codon:yes stop_codon:yes gene_type:complete